MKNIIILFLLASINLFAFEQDFYNSFLGSALAENSSYQFLEKLCTEAGGRLAGTENNLKAGNLIMQELEKLGLHARYDVFKMPCWERGNDRMLLTSPFKKEIRMAVLGYVEPLEKSNLEMVYGGSGYEEEYEKIDAKGKIVLLEPDIIKGKDALLRIQAVEIAHKFGASAVIFCNQKSGGLLQVGVAGFQGKSCLIPAMVITKEDSEMLKKQLKCSLKVAVELEINSHTVGIKDVSNIILTFPGKSEKTIAIGAHFDSWDLSTGAIDNGAGTAALFEIARLINKYSPQNYYTVELVWFNAEETGLWGAKDYAEKYNEKVIALINMDMPGKPTGINIMGFEEFQAFSENFLKNFKGYIFEKGVDNNPWINSDHSPMMLKGVPVFTFYGFMEKEMYWHYHDFADTFDKVNPEYLSEAAAIQGLFALELANATDFDFKKFNQSELIEMLKKYNLDKKLKKQGEWTFEDK